MQHTLKMAADKFSLDLRSLGQIRSGVWALAENLAPYNGGLPANAQDNARRIVAAWNACDGISTEGLEIGLPDSAGSVVNAERLETELARVTKQRDELLAALKDIQLSTAGFEDIQGEDFYQAIRLHPGTVGTIIGKALRVRQTITRVEAEGA